MEKKERFNKPSVGNYISIFYRIGSAYLSQRYDAYQIGFGQYQFLITLYYEDGLSQDELTKRISVDKATTTRAITKLKEQGYVTVSVDSQDKRVHRVWLTDKAKEIKGDILSIAKEWEDKLFHALTEEDKDIMASLFEKMASSNGWLPVLSDEGIVSEK